MLKLDNNIRILGHTLDMAPNNVVQAIQVWYPEFFTTNKIYDIVDVRCIQWIVSFYLYWKIYFCNLSNIYNSPVLSISDQIQSALENVKVMNIRDIVKIYMEEIQFEGDIKLDNIQIISYNPQSRTIEFDYASTERGSFWLKDVERYLWHRITVEKVKIWWVMKVVK